MKSNTFSTATFILVIMTLLQLHITCTMAFPIREVERQPREYDDFNFPDSSEPVNERPSNSCFVHVTKQYNEDSLMHGGVKPTNVTSRRCCDGYTGEECNIISDPYLAASPCSRITCPNFPDATCAVISQCGQDIPIFLDEDGDILDCGGNDTTVQNLTMLSCGPLCEGDPCEGLTCSAHPSAICITTGCSCEPIWLLDTGLSVNCTSGETISPDQVLPRNRRQVIPEPSPLAVETSCSG